MKPSGCITRLFILLSFLVLALTAAPAGAIGPVATGDPAPIVASFSALPSGGSAPLLVSFSDTSTGGPTSWLWDFGDGSSSTDRNPAHVFENAGVYDVTLTASNDVSSQATTVLSCIVAVLAPSAPVAVPGGAGIAADTNGDGLYDDVNGNGRADFADAVLYFNQMSWITANEPLPAFDYNGNGRIDFADAVWLFDRIGGPGVTPNVIPILLNKTVAEGCAGGYVIDGTTFMGDARAYDYVMLNGRKYTFRNNEQFRFTIRGNQTAGQLFVEHEQLSQLTFNARFEVRNFGTTEWMVPAGFSTDTSNPRIPVNIGVPTSVSISAINKNGLNNESTLTYRYPVCTPSATLLRVDGEVRIDDPADGTYLEFANLHAVHDIRYGGGTTTMWMYLEPEYHYMLVRGECISP